jgi:glutathione synthase/RimK-type ligase-like ATP-grasp enzyme
MSPSAYLRGHGQGIFYTLNYVEHVERHGVRVINGRAAYAIETSKALQLSLLNSLGLPYPRARIINHPSRASEAARDLRFPVIIKANIGGSGAGIVRYDTLAALERASKAGTIDLGIDQTALVQEFVPARDGHITRVETLGGKYLYGIRVFTSGESFNLCPADICQTTDGVELARTGCPADAPRTGLQVEACTPPDEVIDAVERIARAAQIDVGGIEYLVDDRDGSLLYYDINALSNFVADAPRVIGFDPHVRLVDFLEEEASKSAMVTSYQFSAVG